MLKVYGLKNCDTCRKAFKWLEANAIDYIFHDVRADGPTRGQAADWIEKIGADKVINRRGTTWRKLSDAEKTISSDNDAIDLVMRNPALIKRPVIEQAGTVSVGFTPDVTERLLGTKPS